MQSPKQHSQGGPVSAWKCACLSGLTLFVQRVPLWALSLDSNLPIRVIDSIEQTLEAWGLINWPKPYEVRPKPRHVIVCEQCHSYYSVPHNLLPQGYRGSTHVSVSGADSYPVETNASPSGYRCITSSRERCGTLEVGDRREPSSPVGEKVACRNITLVSEARRTSTKHLRWSGMT
jgi:hypothetical protein